MEGLGSSALPVLSPASKKRREVGSKDVDLLTRRTQVKKTSWGRLPFARISRKALACGNGLAGQSTLTRLWRGCGKRSMISRLLGLLRRGVFTQVRTCVRPRTTIWMQKGPWTFGTFASMRTSGSKVWWVYLDIGICLFEAMPFLLVVPGAGELWATNRGCICCMSRNDYQHYLLRILMYPALHAPKPPSQLFRSLHDLHWLKFQTTSPETQQRPASAWSLSIQPESLNTSRSFFAGPSGKTEPSTLLSFRCIVTELKYDALGMNLLCTIREENPNLCWDCYFHQ